MNNNKKAMLQSNLYKRLWNLTLYTEKMEDKQQGKLKQDVDSSNLNGLWICFSFQYHTISEHKINITS